MNIHDFEILWKLDLEKIKEKLNMHLMVLIIIILDLIIFLKSNWLESFSYSSLKIMETGGYSIVMPNSGNKDYLNDGEKCLLYKLWDLNSEENVKKNQY